MNCSLRRYRHSFFSYSILTVTTPTFGVLMTITFLAPDGVAITAQQFRQAQAATHGGGSGRRLGGRSGFRVDTPSNVLTATSTTWTLTPCAAMIDPGATTHQGMYGWSTDANVTGSVTAADATYARKDIVYIQVNDSSAGDGSGALTANVLYLAGTPASTPIQPALPARSFYVGTINVPIAGGGSPTVTLNPARYAAAGAPLPVYSSSERDLIPDKYDGLTVQRRDLPGRPVETYDGTAWNHTGRQHAEYTGPAFTTSPGLGINFSNGTGGTPLTLDGTRTFNNDFVQPDVGGRLKILKDGIYAPSAIILPTTVPASYSLNIVDITAGTRIASVGGVGYGDKEQSVGCPGIYLAANTVIEFSLVTSNAITMGSRVRVTRIG